MKARKYLDRFRASEGGIRYEGEYYAFPGGASEARRCGVREGLWLAAWWALLLLHLATAWATDRCLYALMPLLVSLFPGAYGVMGVFAMLTAPDAMTVVQRDRGPDRVERAAVGGLVCTAAGALGCLVRVARLGVWTAAWHEVLLPALAALAMALCLREARRGREVLDRHA